MVSDVFVRVELSPVDDSYDCLGASWSLLPLKSWLLINKNILTFFRVVKLKLRVPLETVFIRNVFSDQLLDHISGVNINGNNSNYFVSKLLSNVNISDLFDQQVDPLPDVLVAVLHSIGHSSFNIIESLMDIFSPGDLDCQ